MQRNRISAVGLGSLLVLAAPGCVEDDVLRPSALAFSEAAAPAGALGLARLLRAWPGEPCATGPYREFDFWVGEWDVENVAGNPAGSNRIEVLLDGCVVAEHWVGVAGLAGRSINTYDADTGMWHQTWVAAQPIGHIRMAGGLRAGTMVMDGVRAGANFSLVDHYEWEEVEPGVVVQSGFRDVPEFDLHFPFALTYRPASDFQPFPIVETTACQPGGVSEASRDADFLLGTWRVEAVRGPAVGTIEITPDLSGCLFEERFATRKGLRWIAFLYFDHVEGAWYRTSIDSEGERLELRGSLADGLLRLEGREPGPNGRLVDVRFTWEAEGPNRIRHRIESSGGAGASWRTEAELLLVRD